MYAEKILIILFGLYFILSGCVLFNDTESRYFRWILIILGILCLCIVLFQNIFGYKL